jgi:hypothetical protein
VQLRRMRGMMWMCGRSWCPVRGWKIGLRLWLRSIERMSVLKPGASAVVDVGR